jgi:hypothetical protein
MQFKKIGDIVKIRNIGGTCRIVGIIKKTNNGTCYDLDVLSHETLTINQVQEKIKSGGRTGYLWGMWNENISEYEYKNDNEVST